MATNAEKLKETCIACGAKEVFPVYPVDGKEYACGSKFFNDRTPFQSDKCKANVFVAELERQVKENARLLAELTAHAAVVEAATGLLEVLEKWGSEISFESNWESARRDFDAAESALAAALAGKGEGR